jgi:hypothetical protein
MGLLFTRPPVFLAHFVGRLGEDRGTKARPDEAEGTTDSSSGEDWPEGLTQAQLRDREEQAWMTMLQMSDLTFEVVKFELIRD